MTSGHQHPHPYSINCHCVKCKPLERPCNCEGCRALRPQAMNYAQLNAFNGILAEQLEKGFQFIRVYTNDEKEFIFHFETYEHQPIHTAIISEDGQTEQY